jgi:hypothetical protein
VNKKDTRVHLVPSSGLLVRDPERGGHLAAEGRLVELTTYWRKRIDDGDVTQQGKTKSKPGKES